MFKCRYGKIMFAPDTGADGGANGTGEQTPEPDWKALYEQEHAEKEKEHAEKVKIKASLDKTSSELAEKKRQEKEQMTEAQKQQAEQEEKEQRYQDAQKELNEYKTSDVFKTQGFTTAEYTDLSKKLVEACGIQAVEVAQLFVSALKKANQTAVANARNGAVVDGAKPPKASTSRTDGQGDKTDYQLYQESKIKSNNIVKL